MVLFRRRCTHERMAKIKAMRWISLIAIVSFSGQLICSPLNAQTVSNDCVVLDWQITKNKKKGSAFDRRKEFNRNDKRVFAFISLNCTRVKSNLKLHFIRSGKNHAIIPLPLQPSPRWRTWASVKTLKGKWLVKAYVGKRFLLSDTFVVR